VAGHRGEHETEYGDPLGRGEAGDLDCGDLGKQVRQAGAGAGKRPGVSSGEPAEIRRLAESLSSGSAEGESKRLPCRWARCT